MPKSARTAEKWRPSARRNEWSWLTSWTELYLQKIQNQVIKKASPVCPDCRTCKSPLYKPFPLTSGAQAAPHGSHPHSPPQEPAQAPGDGRAGGQRAAKEGERHRTKSQRAYPLTSTTPHHLPLESLLESSSKSRVLVGRHIFKRKMHHSVGHRGNKTHQLPGNVHLPLWSAPYNVHREESGLFMANSCPAMSTVAHSSSHIHISGALWILAALYN